MAEDMLFVTRKWPPAVGGMETYCVRLFERLRQRRNAAVLALPGRADGRGPAGWRLFTFGIETFLRLLMRTPAAIVHVSDMAAWPLAWAAALRSRSTKIVISAHGSDLSYAGRPGWRSRAYAGYLRLAARLVPQAQIIANSNWIADQARRVGFRRVCVVRLGTDLSQPLEGHGHNGCLLFAGRIARGKGLDFLLNDVLPLIDNPPRVRVAGSVWDAEQARMLTRANVEWLGTLSPEALAREYAAALAVVVPSRLPEGFGLVAAEAASSGGIVLAADHSGLAEAVLPETGFLLPADDARAWAERVEIVRRWPEEQRAQFCAKSVAAARAVYDWDRTASETEAVYDMLTAPRDSATAGDAPSGVGI